MQRRVSAAVPALVALLASAAHAQRTPPRTYANPIDIDYRYNFEQHNEGISYRSGADPVIVVAARALLPLRDPRRRLLATRATSAPGDTSRRRAGRSTIVVAPAALSVRDTIYLMPSTTRRVPILMLDRRRRRAGRASTIASCPGSRWRASSRRRRSRSRTPCSPARGTRSSSTIRTPSAGSSTGTRRTCIRCTDRARQGEAARVQGDAEVVVRSRPDASRLGAIRPDHRDTTITPFIEGAWMTKHGGHYYLQYGAPGTEYNVYADGTYVGDDPLGPFTYAPYNPVAYKPGGFVHGRRTRQHLPGRARQLVEHGHAVDRRELELRAAHRAAPRRLRRRRPDVRRHALRRFPALAADEDVDARATSCSPAGCCCRTSKPATASSALDSFPASERDGRESAHLLGRAGRIVPASR